MNSHLAKERLELDALSERYFASERAETLLGYFFVRFKTTWLPVHDERLFIEICLMMDFVVFQIGWTLLLMDIDERKCFNVPDYEHLRTKQGTVSPAHWLTKLYCMTPFAQI